jgi:RHS repeat-associated protein
MKAKRQEYCTGPELTGDSGLINMNGRLYDPVLGRFLNADPVIQFPGFTQSYNSYSYVMNNPLRFTDPTGYTASTDAFIEAGLDNRSLDQMRAELYGGLYFDVFLNSELSSVVLFNGKRSDLKLHEDGTWTLKGHIISPEEAMELMFDIARKEAQGGRDQSIEDRIILHANRLAMKELGLNPEEIQSYGPASSLYSKLSKLNNPQNCTEGWSKTFNSSSKKFDSLISLEIRDTGFALKYYPTKNGYKDAIGLVRTSSSGHYIETSLEIQEALLRKLMNMQDDWLYDMHLYNSILFINILR